MMILLLSVIAYGYVKNSISDNATTTAISSPENDILGIWYLENDPTIKIEFLQNGHLKTYVNNVLESDDTFTITNTCNNQTSTDNSPFLQITNGTDNFVTCDILNGITIDNQSLSITDLHGRLIIYHR